MSSQLESIYSDELILLAETLGEVKTRTEKLEGEFSTHAKPLEAATNALSAALSGIKALQFHVLDNNLGALSARVEEMRKAVDEQVGVIALELKKADETNAAKAGADAEALRSEIVALQSQLGSLVTQFGQQLERVEFAAKEEAKKLQLIPGPAGAAGASLNPRGTFIDGETYNRLDVVSWLGSSYIAAVDGVTEKPSKNSNQWQTLASRGGGGAGGVGDFGSLAGVAQINQGGTGQTTRAAGLNALLPDQAGATQYMLLTDGSGTVSWGAQPVAGLPSQTSNSGRLLTTNGSTASWSNAVTVSGSNATVGGTLTVNGASASIVGTAFFGASSDVQASRAAAGVLDVRHPSNTTSRIDVTGATSAGIGYRQSGARDWFVSAESNELRTSCLTANSVSSYESGVLVRVRDTTASTTTSSGALVVSGGVGVAGAIFAGGVLSTVSGAGFNTPDWRFYQSGTSGYIRDLVNGQMALQFISGSASTIQVYATGTQDSTTTTSGALISAGGLGVAGAVNAGTFFGLVDGVTAPSTAGGYARIYVDSADGDLKVKFGDGTVKTIATDS
jgi:hypothetical protein